MKKFLQIDSLIAYLPLNNIDTDMLIPKQFLKTIKRTGLGENLFHEMRYDINGNIIKDFILNQADFKDSQILLGGDNFGCGSSREHAPWALLDFGIRVVIAPSFADIFYNNCFKNSILPIILANNDIELITKILTKNKLAKFSINLSQQTISSDGLEIKFNIDIFRKKCLIEGLDDIALTLKNHQADITDFEHKQQQKLPWLYEAN
jgi:3-isopropylmalate/(R)-2-methylmalate dehydratase small subunit